MMWRNVQIFAAALGIIGALLVALKIGEGFFFFLASSILWMFVANKQENWSLGLMNAVFSLVNILGIYNWMIAP